MASSKNGVGKDSDKRCRPAFINICDVTTPRSSQCAPNHDRHTLRVVQWRQRVWTAIHHARTAPAFMTAASTLTQQNVEQFAIQGWLALHNGQPVRAERYFRAALHHDPYGVSSWLGLSRVVRSQHERLTYRQAALDVVYLVDQLQAGGSSS